MRFPGETTEYRAAGVALVIAAVEQNLRKEWEADPTYGNAEAFARLRRCQGQLSMILLAVQVEEGVSITRRGS